MFQTAGEQQKYWREKKTHILWAGVFVEFKNKCQEMEHNNLWGTKLDSWVVTVVQRTEQRFLEVNLAMNEQLLVDIC